MVPKRAVIPLVIAIFLLTLAAYRSPDTMALVQRSHVLDLDSPSFSFEEDEFNDTETSKDYDYSSGSGGDVTYWVSMPKNSTASSIKLNVTGKIITIYNSSVKSNNVAPLGIYIGDVADWPGNEIVTGTSGFDGDITIAYGSDGTMMMEHHLSTDPINAIAIGDVTSDSGDEIVAGSDDNKIYVIEANSGTTHAWNYTTGGDVKTVGVGDVYGNGESKVIGGGSILYLLDDDGTLNWSVSFGDVNDATVGNVTSDPGNEVVVGNGTGIGIVNSSGSIAWYEDLCSVNSIDSMNVTSDPGNEIVVGCSNNKIYLMNTSDSGTEIVWEYSAGGAVISVAIGDVTSNEGNEIVAGSDDGKIYTLDSSGQLVWDYYTASQVKSVALGNLTSASGNETIAGAVDGYIYAFNFEYFPSNVSIDAGNNGTYAWTYPGSLRITQEVTGLGSDVQYYVYNQCSTSVCDVPLLFHSDHDGRLTVSDINFTYDYNISNLVNYSSLPGEWSRTVGVWVNESVGNISKNVSFLGNPDQDILVEYINLSGSATACDFNGVSYTTATVGSDNACDVPGFTISQSGALPDPFLFWDDTMSSGIPIRGNETVYYYTNYTDNFFAIKDVYIWNETNTSFYNVTSNTTLDDSSIMGMYFLNVTWSGQECNITPSQEDSGCDSGSPSYTNFSCGSDDFYVCRKGDTFRWIQPYSGSVVKYTAGGATNLEAELTDMNVTLNNSIWGDWFNFSVHVNDSDGDDVNVSLWYFITNSEVSQESFGGNVTISGEGDAWFNMTSDETWTGTNYYWFQYQDVNSSGSTVHSLKNTTTVWGPQIRKHGSQVVYVSGNESAANRTGVLELITRINDTDTGTWVQAGVNCTLWVTDDGSDFDSGNSSSTNSSGHCVFHFTPGGNYSVGNQTWKVGVINEAYYNDSNSTGFVLTVKGRVNVTIIEPEEQGILYRNASNQMEAKMVDQYGSDANQSGFNCTFWLNNTYLGSNDTGSDGHCHMSWTPICGYSRTAYTLNVTLSNPTGYYGILDGDDYKNVSLHGELDVTVTEPPEYSMFHKWEQTSLNSTVSDNCGLATPGEYQVNWSVKWKRMMLIDVNKTPGYDEQVFPVIINASYLESRSIDISDWNVNYTRVMMGDVEVPSRVNTWVDGTKKQLNSTRPYYFGNYSELVFLANQSSGNVTYEVLYNESDSQEGFSYMENSGFESGSISPWSCFSVDCETAYCRCEMREEGTETTGNWSLYLSSGATESNNPPIEGASIYVGYPLGQDRIKIRYKPTGQFVNDAYIRVYAGSGMCSLNTTQDVWHEEMCYDTDFSSALWVNVTVHDNGSAGNELDAAHVYVDYICIANSSGDCVNYHSGHPHDMTSTTETYINGSDNVTWSILDERVGLRRIVANASGSYYKQEVQNHDIYVYGWSNLSVGNVTSTNCTYNTTWICRQNATMDVFCYVHDANNSERVWGHNMSFWGDGIYIGSNTTDSDGRSIFNWINSSYAQGNHTITCNITDDPLAFYNRTVNNTADIYFNISTGTTSGEVLVNLLPVVDADDMTKDMDEVYYLEINISNTGSLESMYDVIISINSSVSGAGITAVPVTCPPIEAGGGCDRTSTVNVSYLATEGLKHVYVNVTWLNSDASQDEVSNATSITVLNNTILNIIEDSINHTMPRGGSSLAGNFTIESYGNTDLAGVNLSEIGNDAGNISDWISYSPASPFDIDHAGSQLVNISLNVPDNVTEGVYTTNITANATMFCTDQDECADHVVLTINVTMPDWVLSDTEIRKTIGLMSGNGTMGVIRITNNKDSTLTFNATMDSNGNASGNITMSASTFSTPSLSFFDLEVYHNTTGTFREGTYITNITIANNEDAVPSSANVSLSLKVVNFSISILTPNESGPVSDVVAGDAINITVNATLGGSALGENITWFVRIGGELCSNNLQESSVYVSAYQYWLLNCTAPYIAGNPLYNTLNVTGYYETEDISLESEEEDAVIYRDLTPPQIHDIWVMGADAEGNLEYGGVGSSISIRANVTDNKEIGSVWAELYYQGTSQGNYTMNNISLYVWNLSFTSPIGLGDYNIVVYANDSGGNSNDTSSVTLGYFDVYLPINFNGTITDKDGAPIEANFTLYKNSTQWRIHNFSTNSSGSYKWVVHKRVYDIKVEFMDQEIILYGVDINATAANQHGVPDPLNVTDALSLDMFTINSSDISNVVLPDGAVNKLMAVGIESNFTRVSSNVYFVLDYSEALSEMTPGERAALTESNFDVYRCSEWNISQRTCSSNFEESSIDATVDAGANTISFTAAGTSAYAVAEWEGTGDDGDDDSSDSGSSSGSSSSSSSSTSVSTSSSLPFTITTSIGSIRIQPGENKTYLFSVKNKMLSDINISLDVQGLEDFIFPNETEFYIAPNGTETRDIVVSVPENMGTGTYTGSIVVTSGTKSQEIPISMTVSIEAKDLMSIDIEILTPSVNPGGKLRFAVDIKNLGLPAGIDVDLVYTIKESESEGIVTEFSEDMFLMDSLTFTKSIETEEYYQVGQYYLEIWAYFGEGNSVNEVAVFNITMPYWSSTEGMLILVALSGMGLLVIAYYGWRFYKKWKLEKARYIFPLDYGKIPQESDESFWIGKIADTEKKAWFNPSDLTTHAIVAGATGAGKSVASSVFVEEALEKRIPVVVFDPTAQWTGFVKALDDENIVKYYSLFGMDPKSSRPFKGMIFDITDPQELLFSIKQNFKKYLVPGEITVFTMDKLKPGQYDEAVGIIIDALFGMRWEEATELKLIVVFDEVHRLLEKYGGKGGYISLEKAAREFRKWGIGMIMCSQVLADFKEVIAGNVLTEVQLNTKSITDIQKVETKYGAEFAKKISRQGVGVGMIQNPKYNDGKPYFVQFRPTWHNPHKISAKELELYKSFAERIEKIEAKIDKMAKAGEDTFDIGLELKLAKDKLKQGRFRMAQIYITSLEQHLSKG